MSPFFYLNLSACSSAVREMNRKRIEIMLNRYENGDLMDFFGDNFEMNSVVIQFGDLKIFFFDHHDELWVRLGAVKQVCEDLVVPYPERAMKRHMIECRKDAFYAGCESAECPEAIEKLKERTAQIIRLQKDLVFAMKKVQEQIKILNKPPTSPEQHGEVRLYLFAKLERRLVSFERLCAILHMEVKMSRIQLHSACL